MISMYSGLDSSVCSPSFDKAFVVGPGRAPISVKLTSRITGGQFIDLVDLLSANPVLSNTNHKPQTFLEGRWAVSKRCRVSEVKDILT